MSPPQNFGGSSDPPSYVEGRDGTSVSDSEIWGQAGHFSFLFICPDKGKDDSPIENGQGILVLGLFAHTKAGVQTACPCFSEPLPSVP